MFYILCMMYLFIDIFLLSIILFIDIGFLVKIYLEVDVFFGDDK